MGNKIEPKYINNKKKPPFKFNIFKLAEEKFLSQLSIENVFSF